MVESTGFENQRRFTPSQGSNPCLSAIYSSRDFPEYPKTRITAGFFMSVVSLCVPCFATTTQENVGIFVGLFTIFSGDTNKNASDRAGKGWGFGIKKYCNVPT